MSIPNHVLIERGIEPEWLRYRQNFGPKEQWIDAMKYADYLESKGFRRRAARVRSNPDGVGL